MPEQKSLHWLISVIVVLVIPISTSTAEDESSFPVELFSLVDSDEQDEDPWCEAIYASFYGSVKGKKYYGYKDNLLHPRDELFVALPAKSDNLDCLEGDLAKRIDANTAAFRVIEIRKNGEDGPILEVTVEDLGPWYAGDDPYWEDLSRPDSEDGTDGKGRQTNKAGIDLSYKLAMEMGINGIGKVDWRFKKVDGEYVVVEKETHFRK